jgi:hypothetical protein
MLSLRVLKRSVTAGRTRAENDQHQKYRFCAGTRDRNPGRRAVPEKRGKRRSGGDEQLRII